MDRMRGRALGIARGTLIRLRNLRSGPVFTARPRGFSPALHRRRMHLIT
jgi:hypothetical protein